MTHYLLLINSYFFLQPVIVPRYIVHEKALYFNSTFFFFVACAVNTFIHSNLSDPTLVIFFPSTAVYALHIHVHIFFFIPKA